MAANDDFMTPARMVYQGQWIPLPWNDDYGYPRGGTSAVYLPGFNIYLAFFHTRVNFKSGGARGVDHYYMGGLTLCPHFPFKIHSISAYPIVFDTKWFEGKWYNKVASYSVYPIGLSLEAAVNSTGRNGSAVGKGGLTALLTMGYQDKDGYAVRINIRKLLGMLDFVSHCST